MELIDKHLTNASSWIFPGYHFASKEVPHHRAVQNRLAAPGGIDMYGDPGTRNATAWKFAWVNRCRSFDCSTL